MSIAKQAQFRAWRNRSTCIGHNPTTHEVQGEYEVCDDCLCYVEYGRLEDQTVATMG
jgi:hypothetical protein